MGCCRKKSNFLWGIIFCFTPSTMPKYTVLTFGNTKTIKNPHFRSHVYTIEKFIWGKKFDFKTTIFRLWGKQLDFAPKTTQIRTKHTVSSTKSTQIFTYIKPFPPHFRQLSHIPPENMPATTHLPHKINNFTIPNTQIPHKSPDNIHPPPHLHPINHPLWKSNPPPSFRSAYGATQPSGEISLINNI